MEENYYMNTVKAVMDKSDYQIYDDYLNIQLDNKFLDEIIDEKYSEGNYKGLIPTLLSMDNEEENKIVWERIMPQNGHKTLCPILMCPDDADFFCTIIIAEIENINDEIILWNKIGVNETEIWSETLLKYEYELIGQKVEWFDKIDTFKFEKNEYKEIINNEVRTNGT
jgi:hypothetical protein